MTTATRYQAFISYSHEDEKWAAWLQSRLESLRVASLPEKYPARPIFRDRSDLSAGELTENIRAALRASNSLIVICSPAAARSRWVNQEVEMYQEIGPTRVFPFIVPGSHRLDECFPPALTANAQLGNVEILAADARREADGKRDAMLKIAAAVLDVRFDSLRRRDDVARQRRVTVLISGSLLATAITTWLAVSAYRASEEANFRRQQAEELVSFMVEDLSAELRPIGKLGVLDSVNQRALDYFSSIDVASSPPEMLQRHGKVLAQIGSVRVEQGEYELSLAAFAQSLEYLQRALGSGVNNDRLHELANAHLGVASVHYEMQNIEAAKTHVIANRDLLQQLVQQAPQQSQYAQELGSAEYNLGAIAASESDLDEAERRFHGALGVFDELAVENSDDPQLRTLKAEVFLWLGNIAADREHEEASLEFYAQGVEEHRLSLGLDSEPNRKVALANALTMLAVQERAMRPSAAVGYLEEAEQLLGEAVAFDGDNARWQQRLNRALVIKSATMLMRGCEAQIPSMLEAVEVSAAELLRKDDGYVETHRDRIDAGILAARFAYGQGDLSLAQTKATAAKTRAFNILKRNASDPISNRYYLRAVQLLSRTLFARGNAAAAQREIADALQLIDSQVKDHSAVEIVRRLNSLTEGEQIDASALDSLAESSAATTCDK
ncbi:MAG: toll/interleukin-1 receptor domain-containing protein [Pseudomonadales bacterium]